MNNEETHPSGSLYAPAVSGLMTFSRLPHALQPGQAEIDLAILGIPFDGLVTFRPGARFGPNAIRQSSVLCRNYSQQMEVGVYEQLRAIDAGDVNVNPFNYEETFRQIEARVSELQSPGAAVVSLGGDHSILLPILRATSTNYPGLTLIQFDAHTDTSEGTLSGHRYHHGTSVRMAIEEGLIEGTRIFQIGIRGSVSSSAYNDFAKEAGINILDMQGFHDRLRRDAFLEKLHDVAGSAPCYLTFDVDGVDPAFAPGTGTPVVGGLTSFEALDLMRSLRGLRFIGGDVVEVAPPYDCAEITSLLAAEIAFEIAALIAITRRSEPPQAPAGRPS
ncbi:MAG: agmatinase [Acidobacteria bacterium]|nr:agmatinase [Acidobacteriota bacterium]